MSPRRSVLGAARLTAKRLSRLTDRRFLDIGVVRGHVEELAQDFARKAILAVNFILPRATNAANEIRTLGGL
jgi:hypothetical protein